MNTETQQDVTGTTTEDKSAETEQQKETGAAEEATAGEAKEKEGEAQPAEAKSDPEEEKRKQHNREQFERRQEKKRLRELEIEKARLEGRLEALQSGGKTEQKSDTAQLEAEYAKQNPEPVIDQFETVQEFNRAHFKWLRSQADFVTEQATRKTQEQDGQRQFAERLDASRTRGEEKYEDFRKVVSAVNFHPAMLASIVESERGEDLAYYLASNPKEVQRIEKLSPFLQAKELGKIEAGIESGRLQIKQTTSAPPPPKTVDGNAAPKEDPNRMKDDDAWFKWRAKQREEKRRGRI